MDEDKNSSNLPPVDNTGDVAVPENRQALFTPQPPEPVENTSDTGAQPKTSAYLSHPYLSNHPTQTFNTDTGDIILNSSEPKPKQNKRPFIIGGIAVIALAVIVVLVSLLLNNDNRQVMQTSFQEYASYVLYGDTKNLSWVDVDQADDYMTMTDYKLYQQFYADSHDEYFDVLTKLFNKFMNYFKANKKSLNENSTNIINQYSQDYSLLNALSQTPKINNEVLLNLFLESGGDETLAWVDKNFSNLKGISDDGHEYFNIVKTYAELYLGILENYQEQGCLQSGKIDVLCVEKFAPTEEQTSTLQSIDSLQNQLLLTEAYLVDSVQQGCWEIWNLIGENNA